MSPAPQQQQYQPKTNAGRQELLWKLFDNLTDALIEAFERAQESGKPVKAPMLAIVLMFLRHNGIKAEKTSRGLSKGLYTIRHADEPFKK